MVRNLFGNDRRAWLAAMALVPLVLFGGLAWKAKASENTFRMKATATIRVDGVERTGSSVQEYLLRWEYEPQIGRNGAWRLLARGEGVRIDVPGEEPIYVQVAAGTLFNNCAVVNAGQERLRASLVELQRCDVSKFPAAFRFTNASHTEALPVYVVSDLNGYQFVSMTLEKTDAPITSGAVPMRLSGHSNGNIRLHFDGFSQTMSDLQFKSENFR